MEEAQESSPTNDYPKTYDDPSKIWSIYISEAEKYDKEAAESWKGDMDGILIFAGLFSAVVTAFIIESYKGLKPDPEDTTVALLVQISQQLVAISNGSQANIPTPAPNAVPFVPSPSAVRVNVLWFLSLVFSLGCALTATLVQQWARNYIRATNRRPAPYKHARIRAYLWHGVKIFRLMDVVRAVPLLLHISVCLFFVGLVDFLGSINETIGHMILGILAVCFSLYGAITILPTLYRMCPYRTPLSGLWWHILQLFGLLRYVDAEGKRLRMAGTMADSPEKEAMEPSSRREERDFEALRWTMELLTEDAELEPFVEGIPEFIISPHVTGGQYNMQDLLAEGLGNGIYRLISTTYSSAILNASSIKQNRIIVCLDAIWHVTRGFTGRASWVSCFGADTAHLLHQLRRHESPTIAVRAHCTAALAACRLSYDLVYPTPQTRMERVAEILSIKYPRNAVESLKILAQGALMPDEYISELDPRTGRRFVAPFISVVEAMPLRGIPISYYSVWWALFKTAIKLIRIAIGTEPPRERRNQLRSPHPLGNSIKSQKLLNKGRLCALTNFVYTSMSNPMFASEAPFVIDTVRSIATHPVIKAHLAPENYQNTFVSLLAEATGHGAALTATSKVPLPILDILFDVSATLGHRTSIERAARIISAYLSQHPGSAAAEKAISILSTGGAFERNTAKGEPE